MRHLLAAVTALALSSPAFAYIAVDASRLTLSEVVLEFPDVLLLKLDKFDADSSAYVFAVEEALTGKPPETKTVRFELQAKGKPVPRLAGLKAGDPVILFVGSPDNRALAFAAGGWFLTTPDQGWQRFTQFRDDFRQLFDGTLPELADAVRALRRGEDVVVPIHPAAGGEKERAFVKYQAMFPHRRWPALDPKGPNRTRDEWQKLAAGKSVADRQQAVLALAGPVELLLAAAKDTHPEVRLAAVVGLSQLKGVGDAEVKALARALNDSDRFVCAFAAVALGKAGAKGAVPELLTALGDRNHDHDFRPHRAAEAAEAVLTLVPGTKDADRAVQFFLSDKMLKDHRIDSEGTRTAAARALGRCGPAAKAAVPELVKCFKDQEPMTRVAAAEAVRAIGGSERQVEQAEAVLAKEVLNPDVGVAVRAIRACGSGPVVVAALPALQQVMKGTDEVLRREARVVINPPK